MVSGKQVKFYRKWEKLDIAAAVYPGASFTSLRFDYYYSLNDDVLMKDILAGVITQASRKAATCRCSIRSVCF